MIFLYLASVAYQCKFIARGAPFWTWLFFVQPIFFFNKIEIFNNTVVFCYIILTSPLPQYTTSNLLLIHSISHCVMLVLFLCYLLQCIFHYLIWAYCLNAPVCEMFSECYISRFDMWFRKCRQRREGNNKFIAIYTVALI